MKPVLVSGIQPSGRLHIGNYLGALKNFVDLQNSGKYDCYFFIADLHSLTETFEPKEKHKQILELAADFLAAGLDPKKSTIFQQSQIPAHSELAWILNTITSVGELRRMTQFKEKSIKIEGAEVEPFGEDSIMMTGKVPKNVNPLDFLKEQLAKNLDEANVGLFDYPVLMAADILIYDAKFVPVGDDQKQHLELTRTIARKFNAKFPGRAGGKTFVEPQPIFTKAMRVMSLSNPEKKMSKSQPESCLFVDDSPEDIKKKMSRAVTDSGSEIKYDKKNKPGISNLLEIYSALSNIDIRIIEKEFAGKQYSGFKANLTELITDYFADYRKNKKSLLAKPSTLLAALNAGSEQAAKVAEKKISEVKKKIGIST